MMDTVVMFKIDEKSLALPVSQVQRVIWAVEITAMPGQAQSMLGVINVEGSVIPVTNIRAMLGLAPREIDLDDHIVIAEHDNRFVAFIVDRVEGVHHYEGSELADVQSHDGRFYSKILKYEDELVVVLCAEQLLHDARSAQSLGARV